MSVTLHRRRRIPRSLPVFGVLLAGLLLSYTQPTLAQWTRVQAPDVADAFLYSVDFENAMLGHAIGSTATATYIYRTTDGGHTWAKLTDLGLNPFSLTFLDENIGLAGGRGIGCKCTAISRTTDGGKTWKLDSIRSATGTVDQVPASFGINSFSFLNGTTGYGAGANAIVKTTDRGATWTRLNMDHPTDFMADVFFPTEERGYAIAAPGSNLYTPNILYRTTDGGAHWQRTPNFIPDAGFGEIHFLTPELGFVGGGDYQASLYKTTNGGSNWGRKYADGTNQDAIFSIAFENDRIGYAIGFDGTIVRTTDGGETWNRETTGTMEVLQGISISDGYITVVGSGGTILRRPATAASVMPTGPVVAGASLMPNPVTTSAMVVHPGLAGRGGELIIYDPLGREARRIQAAPGSEVLRFSREGLASGTYIYRLVTGTGVLATGTMTVR